MLLLSACGAPRPRVQPAVVRASALIDAHSAAQQGVSRAEGRSRTVYQVIERVQTKVDPETVKELDGAKVEILRLQDDLSDVKARLSVAEAQAVLLERNRDDMQAWGVGQQKAYHDEAAAHQETRIVGERRLEAERTEHGRTANKLAETTKKLDVVTAENRKRGRLVGSVGGVALGLLAFKLMPFLGPWGWIAPIVGSLAGWFLSQQIL